MSVYLIITNFITANFIYFYLKKFQFIFFYLLSLYLEYFILKNQNSNLYCFKYKHFHVIILCFIINYNSFTLSIYLNHYFKNKFYLIAINFIKVVNFIFHLFK